MVIFSYRSYESNYGVISSSWTADGKGEMTSYKAVIPANTSATLYLPVNESAESFKGATGVFFVKKTTHNNIEVAEYELESGIFNFTITAKGVRLSKNQINFNDKHLLMRNNIRGSFLTIKIIT